MAGITCAPPSAQPLAVQQLGAPVFHGEAGAAEAVDRLTVEGFGALALGEQRPRAGLDAERPVGTAGAGHLREPIEGASRPLGHPGPRRRLDELGYRPVGKPLDLGILTCPLRRLQCLLIAAEAVAQHRDSPLEETQPLAFTAALCVLGTGLDQYASLGLPAPAWR